MLTLISVNAYCFQQHCLLWSEKERNVVNCSTFLEKCNQYECKSQKVTFSMVVALCDKIQRPSAKVQLITVTAYEDLALKTWKRKSEINCPFPIKNIND